MKKSDTIFVCSNCGEEYSKWQGKCANCGAWNTLKEFKNIQSETQNKAEVKDVINLESVKNKNFSRTEIGIFEIDRVLGGGIVPGSVILLSGEPGIGKSTLIMQVAEKLKNSLYISGEESIQQIKIRADRIKINSKNINILTETNVKNIVLTIRKMQNIPKLIIVDSIQTMYSDDWPGAAGSIVQVRQAAIEFLTLAKNENISIFLIGHVTKDGTVAGPKTLEHMVDVVLNLEGEKYHGMRVLRAAKNRFGSTAEIGIFQIENKGLIEIKNPSKLFLTDSKDRSAGSIICATIEGTRPLLIEIQALVTPTVFGYPKRTASGFDLNRLQLIIAILINRASLNLGTQDVYLNVSGGFYLKEPAADLAVAMAIVSSYKNIITDKKTIVFGELTLNGEIRNVSQQNKRILEAKRLGFSKILSAKNINSAIKELNNE